MLQSLQGGRAIAAILVVLVHTGANLAQAKYLGAKPFGDVFDFGFIGVDFFFVLSGFIIMHVHARDIGQPREVGAFFWKRFARAYPPYWVVLALVTPVFFLVPHFGLGHERDPDVIWRAILLFPHPQQHTVLIVSWTMVYEIFFYLGFGALVLNRRFGTMLFLAWTACVFAFPWFDGYPWSFVFSEWHIRILAGVGAAIVVQRSHVPVPRVLAAFGVALLFVTGIIHAQFTPLSPWAVALGCSLGSALAIIGLVEAESLGLVWLPRLLIYLGDATYAIYLVHFPALSVLAKLTKMVGLDGFLPGTVVFVLHAVLAISVGCLFHNLVEKRLHLWSKRFFRRAKAAAPTAPAQQSPVRHAA